MRAIVTGGSGFVGTELVRRLRAERAEVVVYDLQAPDDAELARDVEFVRGDVRELDALREAARGCDSFFHLAAVVPLTRAGEAFHEVNVGGTENAVAAARACGAAHFVHLSSSAIFGIPDLLPITEETLPRPLGAYGIAKLEGERVAQRARQEGLCVAVIRPRTVIGPGRLGIFDLLFDWIRHGSPIFLLGACDRPFQLLSNADMAQAMLLASRKRADADFNVGTDRFGSLRDDLEELARRVGSPSRVTSVPAWLGRPGLRLLDALRLSPLVDWHYRTIDKEFWFDISRAREQLGFRPRDSNVEMLEQAYAWYAAERDRLEQSGRSVHRSPLQRGLLRLLSKGSR